MNQTAQFVVTVQPDFTGDILCGPYGAGVLEGQCTLNGFFAAVNGNHPGVFGSITNPNADGKVFELECANAIQVDPNMPPNGYDPDGTIQLSISNCTVEIVRRNVYEPAE